MKIAVICDVLGEPNNGTTIATLNLINSLKKKGHTVSVVCCDQDKQGQEGYYIMPNLNLGRLINKIVENNGVKLSRPDKTVLTQVIKDADIVHIQLPFATGRAAMKIAKQLDKPVTASFHCQAENFTSHLFLINSKLANKLTYKNFYKCVFRHADRVHYPTAFIRDLFERESGKTRAVVISNGVNHEFFKPSEPIRVSDKFTIVCTGRYSKEKSQDTLIKAIKLSKYGDKIKVIFAGDGPYKKDYIKLAQKLGVDCEFNFYSRQQLVCILTGADLYVHTATVEIEAIACTEAIVKGLVPVICNSEKSATRYFALDENNLYKCGDIADLARKIDFWYENPELKKEYKEKYKSFAQKFDQDACMDRMEQMLIDAYNEKQLAKQGVMQNEEGLLLQR